VKNSIHADESTITSGMLGSNFLDLEGAQGLEIGIESELATQGQ
jgi:hypothetical protein